MSQFGERASGMARRRVPNYYPSPGAQPELCCGEDHALISMREATKPDQGDS
ncbi:hypothetical protein M0657_011975 [Pyricularia oryzae]|uniref:Uncharacterized protein n=3 Tax=Pyricularia oryzae TaxID=318829 RepID=Q2KEL4_PYRO7|nr:hypothetical protein MGCH7_ch7g1022 [Pyricularia oryzae 70-15]ELQ40432.1 hypothetical protein OOU_Y34scaffold00436g1 [Pyricularia oryzae Y34]KAI7908932.1 hypothetical protein M9X92_011919 [Pyricularia oryzae]KAI7909137.1 hypothetical protein M0657_011975 [Pyricularia oryzae]